jgi:phosphotransferase system enzyme I (PtsP)
LRDIVRAADRHDTPVTLCGEMAGKPLSSMALFGLGYRSVSMSPTAIGPVKAMLLQLDVTDLSKQLNALLDEVNPSESIRGFLMRFAEQNGVPI